MKVVCLVPSWTEMLIECGVNVVGRTRFCLHPQDKVSSIAAVGGTKDLSWDKIKELNADLLILDQEENLPWMRDDSPIATFVTHVTSMQDVAGEIEKLAEILTDSSSQLKTVAERWRNISQHSRTWDWGQIPGEIEPIRKDRLSYQHIVYVIWKKPWMRVARQTFIGSMLEHLGAKNLIIDHVQKYPEFQMEDLDLQNTYFLFSSEPFPFHKMKSELLSWGIQGSIVDGESYSWFGARSLRFLESL